MDDDDFGEVEVIEGDAGRTGDPRCGGALDLDADARGASGDEQVELRAAVGGPEVGLVVLETQHVDDRLHHEPFPGRTGFGVGVQRPHVPDAEQGVQYARVAQIDFRRFDLPLGDVRMPGLQLAYHEGARQDVQVAPHRGVGNAEGTGEPGRLPDLSVPVAQHRPETAHGRRRHTNAELRQVPFQKSPYEAFQPEKGGGVGASQPSLGEAAPQPAPVEWAADLVQPQPAQVVIVDPPCQRLRRLPDQVGRGAAEHQELRRSWPAVRQHAQHREEIGATLHLVENHEAAQLVQYENGILQQPVEVGGILQVQMMHGPRIGIGDLPRQGRLADLPRTRYGDHRKGPQPPQNGANMLVAMDHGANLPGNLGGRHRDFKDVVGDGADAGTPAHTAVVGRHCPGGSAIS